MVLEFIGKRIVIEGIISDIENKYGVRKIDDNTYRSPYLLVETFVVDPEVLELRIEYQFYCTSQLVNNLDLKNKTIKWKS